MTNVKSVLCLLVLGSAILESQAREFEGSRENSILLNGVWEFGQGDGSENADLPAGQRKIEWQQVTSLVSSERSNSIRSNFASPPMAVGAIPVSLKDPKSFQRSLVTTVQLSGRLFDTQTAFQPVVFSPLK